MTGVIFLIITIIVLILGAFVVFRTAEIHELHKMRAAFDDRRLDIIKNINQLKSESKNKSQEKSDDVNDIEDILSKLSYEHYQGELEEIDAIDEIIDEELNILKFFDSNSD